MGKLMSDILDRTTVDINRLFLDLENPRHDPYSNQSEAIAYLCENENILELAKDIKKIGLNPLETIGLISSKNEQNNYIVVEGNRRICALKLLNDPELAPKQLKGAFEKIKNGWNILKKIECVVFPDRNAVHIWLDRIHNGEAKGVGRRSWNATQKARFSGNNPNRIALFVLDYATQEGFIKSEDRKNKITTIQRYFSNPLIRSIFGIEIDDNDQIVRTVEKESFDLLIKIFLQDLLTHKVHSRTKKSDIENYSKNLEETHGKAKRIEIPAILQEAQIKDKSIKLESEKKQNSIKEKAIERPKISRTIRYDKDIKQALEKVGSKLSSLYYSICNIWLHGNTPLLTVGAWSILESLSARAGRNAKIDFPSYFSSNKLTSYGLDDRNKKPGIKSALENISVQGNITKHDRLSGNFNGEQLANDMETLKDLILKCVEDILEKEKNSDDPMNR